MFNLSSGPKGIPPLLAAVRNTHVESVYLQTCMRAAISASRYLRRFHGIEVSRTIAALVMGAFPGTYHTARALETALKHMNTQYGEIHGRFSHLDKYAAQILTESPFEKNVFVMMPFRQARDERYETIERILRSEPKKHGFRAWLALDKTLAPQLWDNVASFLIACKYGVAVFTRLEKETSIEEEFNPSVSLELGFCLSRGRKILILKDVALRQLHTDLVGHLYEEFDLNRVGRQLPPKVRKWVRQIRTEEEKPALKRDS